MTFQSLGLSEQLLRVLTEEGYSQPTPVQEGAIPPILAGRDMLVSAQTGTGKTAGFTLPMLERLKSSLSPQGKKRVRALILTPTRELAVQVAESVQRYGAYLPLKAGLVYGGVSIGPQIRMLQKGVDILIATPGRLLDHLSQRTLDLSHVQFLVLDEADRMLDMGFIQDIERVVSLLPQQRQTLLFSATFSPEIKRLAARFLRSPETLEVKRSESAAQISQVIHPVDQKRKKELLSFLITSNQWKQLLVFTRTKHRAQSLSEQLVEEGIPSVAIHGDKSQGARMKALADFKRGAVRVLVATDVAARGLDIDDLPLVINFEIPNVPEDYVHRIGRTGRAGNVGEAISFVSAEERSFLRGIERFLNKDLMQVVLPGFEPKASPSKGPSKPSKGKGRFQGHRSQRLYRAAR